MPHPPPTPYAIRRTRPSESGRWVIVRNGFPNDVRSCGFLTKWGAYRIALKWKRQHANAERMEPV